MFEKMFDLQLSFFKSTKKAIYEEKQQKKSIATKSARPCVQQRATTLGSGTVNKYTKRMGRILMEFPKQLKDQVYRLLQEPTLEEFRNFLHAQMGEHNAIDFKSQWIEDAALAKEMLVKKCQTPGTKL